MLLLNSNKVYANWQMLCLIRGPFQPDELWIFLMSLSYMPSVSSLSPPHSEHLLPNFFSSALTSSPPAPSWQKIQLSKWSQRRSCRRRMTDSVCGACGPPPLQHFASECERMCLASVLGRRPRCRVVCDDWAESLHINACVRDITERAGWRKSISSRSDAYGTVRSRRHRSSPG